MSEVDYQKTLNLPQTDFSMKANLAQKEPGVLAQWEKDGVYAKIRAKSKGKKTYTLHDGPPYANGNIHIGHALNKILKDMIVKSKTMQDFDSLYVPGWDCHGLPIEHQIFKDLKKRKSEVESVAFRKMAHDYAMKYVGLQREQFKRLGILGEWENPYLTLSTGYEYWILNSFIRLVEKGYVYRGLKPVNWCGTCETALAEAEVEYEDHTSPSVFVKFKINNFGTLKSVNFDKPVYLLIWTTTPWTLLANVAVAVHMDYQYSFVDTGNGILVIESALAASVLEKAGVTGKVIREVEGDDLRGITYDHPFGVKTNCCVIAVDYVTKEDGTGLVHTAPGHGQDDFQAGQRNNLDILMPVNDQGVFTKDAGKYEGQYIFKANENIIADLKERGILLLSQNISHSYPHCWRCKKPILFRATKQWFLKIDHDHLRTKVKDVIKEKVQWIPAAGQERILGMVTTRPDWCLSRQRHWGVPIPAIKCKKCEENKLFPEVMTKFADMVKKEGTDVWFSRDVAEFLLAGLKCPCGGTDFEKTFDILDVWFDSGVSHQAVIGPMLHQELPADLYLEGSDQHRGWFQSSLIPAVALDGEAPFRAVLTHGFVVDGQGRKMSKSLGNVVSPDDVLKNYGADILRLWVASSNYSDDIRLSKEILERLIDAYRKIRNTMRYLLSNLYAFDPDQEMVAYKDLVDIDQWALSRLSTVLSDVKGAYDAYDFAKVYQTIYSFCNDELSGFYLDILKDRLYTSHAKSLERRSAQTVLYHILNHLVRLLAPVLAFTSDEVFSAMPKGAATRSIGNVHLLSWLDIPADWHSQAGQEAEEKYKLFIAIRPFVMKALEDKRKLNEIGSPLEAAVVFRSSSERDLKYFEDLTVQLPELFIVSQVKIEKVSDVKNGLSEHFPKTEIIIERAEGEKCSRCWHYSVEVGKDAEHPSLCERCSPVVREILVQ
ncbi:MAG: isoleucine--tRNA ligase [Candidatus Omnitrophica bacterium]|nr:isoleucine--tRNA ligase [Candidatus Omnitrophota bacterium]